MQNNQKETIPQSQHIYTSNSYSAASNLILNNIIGQSPHLINEPASLFGKKVELNQQQKTQTKFSNTYSHNPIRSKTLTSPMYKSLNFQQQEKGKQQQKCHKISQPILLINKIQEQSLKQKYKTANTSIVNKQIAYDCLYENNNSQQQKSYSYRIQNCASSTRPNSEIYKRLSKPFFENLKNGVNQCILFIGSEANARIQTSIGNSNNPGMFMIIAIAILDEKYKENPQRFDVEFSFLEYRNQHIYDLLNKTQEPLKPIQKQSGNKSILQFSQHRVKICTFLQFIKLFKIALFNNKQRDFKTTKVSQDSHTFQGDSTFMMKVRIKKYSPSSQLLYEQETLLIDFEPNCYQKNASSQQSNKNSKMKQSASSISLDFLMKKSSLSQNQEIYNLTKNQNLKQSTTKSLSLLLSTPPASRSLLDYVLIEINNAQPNNKPIHYHMVEKNLLLMIIKKYISRKQVAIKTNTMAKETGSNHNEAKEKNRNGHPKSLKEENGTSSVVGGQVFLINSLTTNEKFYEKNIILLQSLKQAIGSSNCEALAFSKCIFSKHFNSFYYQNTLNTIVDALKTRMYTSLRDLYDVKEYFTQQCKNILLFIKEYKNVMQSYLKLKKDLKYSQNVFLAYQMKLIGNCIKSDNFKDFYLSKSYLALPRQIQIKTEPVKQDIINIGKQLEQIQEKLSNIKKNQIQSRKSASQPPSIFKRINNNLSECPSSTQFLQSKNNNNKFKPVLYSALNDTTKFSTQLSGGFNQLNCFLSLKKYVMLYLEETWDKIKLQQERTITEEVLFEERFDQQIETIKIKIKEFINEIQTIQESNINYAKSQQISSMTNYTQLIRSINDSKKKLINFESKKDKLLLFKQRKNNEHKKQNNYRITSYLPKIHNSASIVKQGNCSATFLIKKQKKQIFQISGALNFQTLMMNPCKNK